MLAPLQRSAKRLFAANLRFMSAESHSFSLANKFEVIDSPEIAEVEATKEEMMSYFRDMYAIRRMEILCDTEYKSRNIRGFCHLSDGQEAIAVGLQAALSKDDDIISTYRCHGLQYIRGDTAKRIFAELFGLREGVAHGKGGSMHLYSKKNRMWGGAAIVGAQVPIGAGLAFANKYKSKDPKDMTVAVAMYGDGAANQGQVWEAANMAKLWGLPCVFLCENNQYGMGTSVARSSANTNYYQQGGVIIPGLRIDGMDVLAVKAGMQFVRDYCSTGNGPMFVEVKTYRYHGHSMSDPGITYRDREEVNEVRKTRDCIALTRNRIVEAGWATSDELKKVEKEIREQIDAELKEAKAGKQPEIPNMYEDIFHNEVPRFIRGATIGASLVDGEMKSQV